MVGWATEKYIARFAASGNPRLEVSQPLHRRTSAFTVGTPQSLPAQGISRETHGLSQSSLDRRSSAAATAVAPFRRRDRRGEA